MASAVAAILVQFHNTHASAFTPIDDPAPPVVTDADLRVEKVITGLALPTSMVFIGDDDVLVLEKNSGKVRLVSDGVLLEESALEVIVNTESERGLLGVAVSNTTVFLYYTEEDVGDVRNRVYRYTLSGNSLTDETLILDLPGTPGANHDGGKLTIGPDGMLYVIIGDLNRDGKLQNFPAGADPDDTSVIVKVDFDGVPAANVLSGVGGLESYYAYGIRNSFGMDFDPVTDMLWDTENGPASYDEINVVEPGFNSGWEQVMGPIGRTSVVEGDLVAFTGSHYADPVFSWLSPIGVTDIEFLDSVELGEEYTNNIFVGDINNGNLYYFEVNEDRDGISFDNVEGPVQTDLADLVADDLDERDAVTFGTDFGGITDIETGPDGYLYILTFGGDIYRVVPTQVSKDTNNTIEITESVAIGTQFSRSIADQLEISADTGKQKIISSGGGGSGGGGGGGGGGAGGGSAATGQTTPTTYPNSYFEANPLSKIVVTAMGFSNAQGAEVSRISIDEQVSVLTTFTNFQNKIQSYAYIVQIIDIKGTTVNIDFRIGNLPAGGTTTLSFLWNPEVAGDYTVKVFIWDGLITPTALSEAGVSAIEIAE